MKNYRKLDQRGHLFSAIEYQQSVQNPEISTLKLYKIID